MTTLSSAPLIINSCIARSTVQKQIDNMKVMYLNNYKWDSQDKNDEQSRIKDTIQSLLQKMEINWIQLDEISLY